MSRELTDKPNLNTLTVGDQLPQRQHTPSHVQLMLYNAALWNGHRIHFDEPYTTQVEGYPALVIAGPTFGRLAQSMCRVVVKRRWPPHSN